MPVYSGPIAITDRSRAVIANLLDAGLDRLDRESLMIMPELLSVLGIKSTDSKAIVHENLVSRTMAKIQAAEGRAFLRSDDVRISMTGVFRVLENFTSKHKEGG